LAKFGIAYKELKRFTEGNDYYSNRSITLLISTYLFLLCNSGGSSPKNLMDAEDLRAGTAGAVKQLE
jgi:hypothetical protein